MRIVAWMGALAALCSLLVSPGFAQRGDEPELRAYLESGVIKLGDQVNLVVTVENAGNVSMEAVPAVEGLAIGRPQGPSINRSESWVNGRRSRQTEHIFVVPIRPEDKGEYTVPQTGVTVDGRRRLTPELALTVVEDLRGAELGLFEIRASSTKVVEGQPFSIEIVFGVDKGLGQRVNYVNLSLPWWDQLSGALELETESPGTGGVDFELNSRERVRVERTPDQRVRDRDFIMFRLVRSFLPTRTGTLDFPTSFVEFGEVDERRDFFRTQRRKVETWYVRADDLSIEVLPLPEAGRPLDFGGALGSIAAEAQAEPRDVDAGDSIKLTVEWSGSGNLEFFQPPDLDRLEAFRNFRVYGMTDEVKSLDRRRVTYDLAPLTSEVTEIPSVPLPVFDPELGTYSTVETAPLAVRVRALENPVGLTAEGEEDGFERDVADIVTAAVTSGASGPGRGPGDSSGDGPGDGTVVLVLGATPLLWLGLRVLGRRGRDPDAPLERRRRGARGQLRKALRGADDPKAELDAFNAFLAARTRERDQAWLGRADELGPAAGLADELGRELSELVRRLERAAFGSGERVSEGDLRSLADRLTKGGL